MGMFRFLVSFLRDCLVFLQDLLRERVRLLQDKRVGGRLSNLLSLSHALIRDLMHTAHVCAQFSVEQTWTSAALKVSDKKAPVNKWFDAMDRTPRNQRFSAEETKHLHSVTMPAAYLSEDRPDIAEAVKSVAQSMRNWERCCQRRQDYMTQRFFFWGGEFFRTQNYMTQSVPGKINERTIT